MEPPVRFSRVTAGGRAAVAVWRIDGAADALDRFERRWLGLVSRPRPALVRLVRFGPPPGESSVYIRYGETSAELHTHGGDAVAARVAAAGGDLHPQPKSFADECATAFANARTRRTAALLAGVCFGRLEEKLRTLRGSDGPAARLRSLLDATDFGLCLTRPRRVVLFGPPNVGKSSLMNRVAGFDRSIVADTPGVTRDAVTVSTAVRGWPIEVVDTAGLRNAVEAVEREGVARTKLLLESADLRVLVLDNSSTAKQASELTSLADIVVRHKSDLPGDSHVGWPDSTIRVSSLTGEGVEQLLDRVGDIFDEAQPPGGSLFFVTERQRIAAESLLAAPADEDRWARLLLEVG